MLWIPQYNGAGTFNAQQLFAIGLDGGPINVIALVHFKSGGANLNFSAADSAGVSMGSINFGTFNAVAGTEYEVEINYDFTSGDVRLFIDGVQFGGLGNLTGVRTNNIDKIRIGDSMDLNVVGPEFHSKWLALFDTVQHTGNYTPIGALLTVLLFPAETSVLHNAGQLMDGLLNLAETDVNVPAGSSLKYIMQVDGIDMWFDGANWSASNGLAVEANTLAEVDAIKAALDFGTGSVLKLKVIIVSDTATRASVTTHTVDYCFAVPPITPPNVCRVFDTELDGEANPRSGVEVTAKLIEGFNHTTGGYVTISEVKRVSDSLGNWEMPLAETATDAESWIFCREFVSDDGTRKKETSAPKIVPNEPTKNFGLLADA